MKTKLGDNSLIVLSQKQIEEYAEWFDSLGEWTLRANISFRRISSYDWAKKRLKWFFKYLNKAEERYFDKRVKALVFYEKQNTSRSGIHIHALIEGIDSKFAEIIQEKAKAYFGEYSCILPYDPTLGFKYYVAKKVGTQKLVEYDLYIINSKIR